MSDLKNLTEAKIDTSTLTHRLFRKFDTSEDEISGKYIVATQVRANGSSSNRTADAVIIGNWPSAGYEIQGFEIKVSRSDWLNELKEPTKCEATKKYCDRWWLLIASESMVKDGELPEGWGLMVPHGTGIRIVKQALELTPAPITPQFITGLMRANKRNHLSEDLHAQYLQDAKRSVEAKLKAEYDDLKQFVKLIKDAFGIELSKEERWVKGTVGQYEKYWIAKIRGRYSTYTPEQLKSLIEATLSGDLTQTEYSLRKAYDDAKETVERLEKYKGKKLW